MRLYLIALLRQGYLHILQVVQVPGVLRQAEGVVYLGQLSRRKRANMFVRATSMDNCRAMLVNSSATVNSV